MHTYNTGCEIKSAIEIVQKISKGLCESTADNPYRHIAIKCVSLSTPTKPLMRCWGGLTAAPRLHVLLLASFCPERQWRSSHGLLDVFE